MCRRKLTIIVDESPEVNIIVSRSGFFSLSLFRFLFLFRFLGHPDMTFAIDWALKKTIIYLSVFSQFLPCIWRQLLKDPFLPASEGECPRLENLR